MKRRLSIFIFALVIALFSICFAACGDSDEKIDGVEKGDVMTLVIMSGDKSTVKSYEIALEDYTASSSVEDALNGLKNKGVWYENTEGAYGVFLTAVGYTEGTQKITVASQDSAAGRYIFIYTDVTDCYSTQYGSIEYNGKTLGSANYGLSGLPLEKDKTVVITEGNY